MSRQQHNGKLHNRIKGTFKTKATPLQEPDPYDFLVEGGIDKAAFEAAWKKYRAAWNKAHPEEAQAEGKKKPSPFKMKFAVLNGVVDHALRDLSGNLAKVWIVLFRDSKGVVVESSVKWVAERAGLSVRHTKRLMTELRERGYLELLRRGYSGQIARHRLKRPKGVDEEG